MIKYFQKINKLLHKLKYKYKKIIFLNLKKSKQLKRKFN